MKEYQTFNNFEFIVGNSAKENDILLKKYKNTNTIWFHLEHFPSAHGFLLLDNQVNTNNNKPQKHTFTDIKNAGVYLLENIPKKHLLKQNSIIYTHISNLKLTEIVGQVILKKKPDKIVTFL